VFQALSDFLHFHPAFVASMKSAGYGPQPKILVGNVLEVALRLFA
jgi:hypothetical protein